MKHALEFDSGTNSDSENTSNSKASDSKASNSTSFKESKTPEVSASSQNFCIRARNSLIDTCSTNYVREKLIRILDGKMLMPK